MTVEDLTYATGPGEDDLDALAAGDLVTGEGLGGEDEAAAGPDDAQMRRELRERGHNPGTRGRLGREWVELWASGETAPGIEAGAGPGTGGAGPADFEPDHARQVKAERQPKRPRARRLRDRLGLGDDTGPGKRKSGREKTGPRAAKPKHERVSLDRLGEGAFGLLARMTRVADPPLSRAFALEAPLAGIVFDRTLAGGPVDRVLQPVARAQAKANTIAALFGLPVGVIMLEQAAGLQDGNARAIREGVILAMMRECAVMLGEVAGETLAERAERNAARDDLYAQADAVLQHILFGAPLGDGEEPGQAPGDGGDQAAARAQEQATPGGFGGFMAPAPAGDPARPPYAHPYPPVAPGAQLARRP